MMDIEFISKRMGKDVEEVRKLFRERGVIPDSKTGLYHSISLEAVLDRSWKVREHSDVRTTSSVAIG